MSVYPDRFTTRIDDVADDRIDDKGYQYIPESFRVIGVTLEMPPIFVASGDVCRLEALIKINVRAMENVPFFAALDIAGEYWFWDDWTHRVDFNRVEVPSGETEVTIIEEFIWPDTGDDAMENLMFLSAVMNPEMK